MNAEVILTSLRLQGAQVKVEGEELCVIMPRGTPLTDEMRAAIQGEKPAIMATLLGQEQRFTELTDLLTRSGNWLFDQEQAGQTGGDYPKWLQAYLGWLEEYERLAGGAA